MKTSFLKIYISLLLIVCGHTMVIAAHADVFAYYKKINLAELAICDSNFIDASKYYAEAFTINPAKAFYRDLNNAMGVAMDINDYTLAEKYLVQLLHIGIDPEEMMHMRQSYTGIQLAQLNAMLSRNKNNTLPGDPILKTISEMVAWDQDVRLYYSSLYRGAYMVDSVYTVDYINSARLLSMFKEQGIPSQAILKASHSHVIIGHNTGAAYGGRPAHIFDELLYNAIFTFDFDARSFITIVEESPNTPSFKHGNIELVFPLSIQGCFYKSNIYPEYYNEPSESRINAQRAKIGLESLDDYRKKIVIDNKSKDSNSIWHKYMMRTSMKVRDVDNEKSLTNWLAVNGKDAVNKRSVFDMKFTAPKPETFEIGSFGDQYIINQTTYKERMKYYQCGLGNTPGANTGYEGTIIFQDFESKSPPLNWNYKAEVVENPVENLATESGRYNKAQFVPGYKMLIESGYTIYFGRISDMQMIFDNEDGYLIRFSGRVDTVFYKTAIRYIGKPSSYTVKRDTVTYPLDRKYVTILLTRTYTWIKGSTQTQIVLTERLSEKGRKTTTANYYMTHTPKYSIYIDKLMQEKKRLDKKYNTTLK